MRQAIFTCRILEGGSCVLAEVPLTIQFFIISDGKMWLRGEGPVRRSGIFHRWEVIDCRNLVVIDGLRDQMSFVSPDGKSLRIGDVISFRDLRVEGLAPFMANAIQEYINNFRNHTVRERVEERGVNAPRRIRL